MVKSRSQMMVIGGSFPAPHVDICDGAQQFWGQHNIWTGTLHNAGNNSTYWALFDPNVTTNVVPVDVYNVIGGNKNGGATLVSPKGGFDPANGLLQTLFQRKASFTRTATITPTATATSISSPGPTNTINSATPAPHPKKLLTGAILGIAIGGAIALVIVAIIWISISKRVHRNRQNRRQSQMPQMAPYVNWPSMASPHPSAGPGSPPPFLSPPLSELEGRQSWGQKTDQRHTSVVSPVRSTLDSPTRVGTAM